MAPAKASKFFVQRINDYYLASNVIGIRSAKQKIENSRLPYKLTTTFPKFYSISSCRERFAETESNIQTEKIEKELVHPFTKDFKGGIQVTPSKTAQSIAPFQEGDVIIKAGGKRIQSNAEFYATISRLNPKGKVAFETIRDGKIKTLYAPIKDSTQSVIIVQNESIKELCRHLKKPTVAVEDLPKICR